MVTVEELRKHYKLASNMELLDVRRNAEEMLQRAGLAAEDLALIFMALGCANDELQMRGIATAEQERRQKADLLFRQDKARNGEDDWLKEG